MIDSVCITLYTDGFQLDASVHFNGILSGRDTKCNSVLVSPASSSHIGSRTQEHGNERERTN